MKAALTSAPQQEYVLTEADSPRAPELAVGRHTHTPAHYGLKQL